jgi:hypothetical protein
MDQYIYQADVYCVECAEHIMGNLKNQGRAPANPEDEHTFDSDDYPKGPFSDQESDCPEHCASCHVFLENPLTSEGYAYVQERIAESDKNGRGNRDVIEEWREFYDIGELRYDESGDLL